MLKKLLPKLIGKYINTLSLFSKRRAAEKAFDIFCTVRRGRIKEDQKEFLFPAKDTQLVVDGNPVQTYHWYGTGAKVLLIHGWESNTHRWWKLIADLQQLDYDIYAFDAPAHGASSGTLLNVPLYTKALEAVTSHYKPDYHIAHSIGGLTAIYHYHTHKPKHVSKMVTLGAASELSEIMVDYQHILGLSNKVMHALEHHLERNYGFTFKQFSGAAFAKSITVPGLIIHDKDDTITPVAASRAIHNNWKNSNYIETTGLGHSLYQDEIRQAILKFLKQ